MYLRPSKSYYDSKFTIKRGIGKKSLYGACCNKTRQSEHSIMWHKWGVDYDYDVAVKLTSVTDDFLKSNNGAHS